MGKSKSSDGGKDLSTKSKKLKKNGVNTDKLVEELLSEMRNKQQKSEGGMSFPSKKQNKFFDESMQSKKKSKKHKEGMLILFINYVFPGLIL